MKKMKNHKGFTLIELMVVLVIIGILATLAIPKFAGAQKKSKAVECKPFLAEIYTLQVAYQIETQGYAAAGVDLGYNKTPGGRYDYSNLDGSGAGTSVGVASLNAAGAADNIGAVGDLAAVIITGAIEAEAALAGLLNVPIGTCD